MLSVRPRAQGQVLFKGQKPTPSSQGEGPAMTSSYQQHLSPGLDPVEVSCGSSSPGLASVSGAAEDRASLCCAFVQYADTARATWPHHPRKQQAHQMEVCSGSFLVISTGCHLLSIYCLSGIGTCSHLILNTVLSGKF